MGTLLTLFLIFAAIAHLWGYVFILVIVILMIVIPRLIMNR